MSAPSETMISALGSPCDSRSDADPTAAAKPAFGGGQNACTQGADRLLRPPDLSTDACRSSRGPSALSWSHCMTYRPMMAARAVHWAVVWSHRLKVVSSPRKVERDVRIVCQCTGPTATDDLGRCPDRSRDGFDELEAVAVTRPPARVGSSGGDAIRHARDRTIGVSGCGGPQHG